VTTELELADGRRLTVRDHGGAGDALVIVHQTTPGGTLLHEDTVRQAGEHGLRLVSYARPGYADSTRAPGRTVGDAAADTAAVADFLAAPKFLTWGTSGGGPHALACAARLPDRVVAAATLASVGPYGVAGFDFFDGMGEGNIEEFGTVLSGGRPAIEAALEPQVSTLLAAKLEDLVDSMAPHLSEVDAVEMRGPFGGLFLAQIKEGCAHGAGGWVDDDLAFVAPWGFDVADIRVPVLLLQGRQDEMVPFAHGQWLAGQIPGVDARLSEEDGHLTLTTRRLSEVFGWLRERWDAR